MSGILSDLGGLLTAGLTALGLGPTPTTSWNGYVEADYVHVAALSSGRITAMAVDEGDMVAKGAPLVMLETDAQVAALATAKAGVAQAQANLDNLSTGSRDAEVAVIGAALKKAQADRDLAQSNLERTVALKGQGAVTNARLQQDQNALAVAAAQVEQLQAQLQVAHLPARDAQRLAAEAALDMARSQENAARIALDDRSLSAPITGRVDQRFYDPGEVAGAGAPILTLYDPGQMKVIFFVPEARRAALQIGAVLAVSCDGCPGDLQATVTRIGAEPQFTPPILYSRDERGRLVFRAEARLGAAEGLTPGQPVSLDPVP
jgi:HlyD family secretion protein